LSVPDNKIIFTRENFEKLIAPKINKTIELTKNLLEDLNLESLDIKGVIMVGGSSRIPLIHKKLGEIFNKAQIFTNLDPDRVVASGAAWQAYNLSGNSQNLLLDVTPLSLGVEMMGGIVDKIIERNTTIPAAMAKEFTTYADNQTGLKLHIVQGEREFAKDCRSLAEFEIKNIPAMRAGLARVLVTFRVDADGLLTVSAEERITGKKQEIIVKPTYGIDEGQIKNMLIDSMRNAKTDMAQRLEAEAIREAKQNLAFLKRDLNEYGFLVDEKEKTAIEKDIINLENALELSLAREEVIAAQKQLEKTSENFVLQKMNKSLEYYVSKKIDDI
jgi:molecular chaperone HscA